MRKLLLFLFALINYTLYSQHTNVLISTANNPNEPSIFIHPKNTDTILAASNIANYYISYDGGFNWSEHVLTSTYGVWGDPVLTTDTAGNFFFLHLSNTGGSGWIDRIVAQKSTDAGQTWNNGSFMGLNGTKDQDKHWVAVDQANNNMYVTWTEFDAYGSTASSCKSKILFSKSLDAGTTWSSPLKINEVDGDCVDGDETTEGAVPAVGPNGEIYVAWAGPDGLVFDKSYDQGNTWLANDVFVDGMPYGWDYNIPGLGRANGLPITKCDISGKSHNGTIYINWSDQRNGLSNTDVWLVKSTDDGNTWTSPIRVNQDNSQKHQFFTWMDIDQTTGYLYFVYYDRRNYSDNQTDVYMAYSVDGGETFREEKISDAPFTPNTGVFFGDYNNISVRNGIIRPIWTRLQSGALSVYTAIIDTALLDYTATPLDTFIVIDTIVVVDTLTINDTLFITDTLFINGDTIIKYDTVYVAIDEFIDFDFGLKNYPNPSTDRIYFSFKLHEKTNVSLKIYNFLGQEVVRLIDEEKLGFGKHILVLDTKEKRLAKGSYFYIVELNGKKTKKRLFIVE